MRGLDIERLLRVTILYRIISLIGNVNKDFELMKGKEERKTYENQERIWENKKREKFENKKYIYLK